MSAAKFEIHGPSKEDPEVCSPLMPKIEVNNKSQAQGKGLSPKKVKKITGKRSWKKIVREKGKAQEVNIINQSLGVGKKRLENIEALAKTEGRDQKCVSGEYDNNNSTSLDETAVAASPGTMNPIRWNYCALGNPQIV